MAKPLGVILGSLSCQEARGGNVSSGTRLLTSVLKRVSVTLRPPLTTKSSEIPQSYDKFPINHDL